MSEALAIDIFDTYTKDSQRISVLSNKYKNKSLIEAFNEEYKLNMDVSSSKNIDTVQLELGQIYSGKVESISKRGVTFNIPGLKSQIICKDNFTNCLESVNMYLASHNNELYFEVREKDLNTVTVSILNAYYRKWVEEINDCIKNKDGISVHIDSLIRGGYICHTCIWPLYELTGNVYTTMAFIPGSQIVLNIERDFEKWIGEDVVVVPQNFQDYVDYTVTKRGNPTKSLVCSRKKVLQMTGLSNLYNMYENKDKEEYTNRAYNGVVTGIINSKNKTGVFVELTDEYITGLMPLKVDELLNYHPGDALTVKINKFEVQDDKQPFVTKQVDKDNIKIVYSNVKPIFEQV